MYKRGNVKPVKRRFAFMPAPLAHSLLALAFLCALPGALSGQDVKTKDDKREEKKPEPFPIKKVTQGMGLERIGPLSPDGKSILLIGKKPDRMPAAYIMDLAGFAIRPPLTNLRSGVTEAAWSPSGEMIAFSGSDETASFPEVYVLDAGSGKQRQLTRNNFSDRQPVFTPDGKRLLFTTDESPLPDAAFGILHVVSVNVTGGRAEAFTDDEGSSILPEISPDGKTVLVVKVNEITGRHSLWEYDLNGKPLRSLTERRFARIHRYITTPSGLIVIWAQEQAEQQDNVYLLDAKTTAVRELPEPDLPKLEPAISPDGKLIAFIGPAARGRALYLFDSGAGQITQLTHKGVNNYSPRFISNTMILFGSDRDGEKEIYSVGLSQAAGEAKKGRKD